jgi:hypothetical protein
MRAKAKIKQAKKFEKNVDHGNESSLKGIILPIPKRNMLPIPPPKNTISQFIILRI